MTNQSPRELPCNLEAEQALLGALFVDNDVFGRVASIVQIKDFFEPLHGRIFDIASKMIDGGKVCNPITIKDFLPDIDLGGMTVPQYIARLAASATTIINAPDYARTISAMARRREMIAIGEDLVAKALDAAVDEDPSSVAGEAIDSLGGIGRGEGSHKEPEAVSVVGHRVVEHINDIRIGKVVDDKIFTGIGPIDKLLGGVGRQNMVVVAARPGMGKTSLAIQAALNISKGDPVLYFSLEMERGEITERCISNLAFNADMEPISYALIRRPSSIDDNQMHRIIMAQRALRDHNLIIEDASGLTCERIAFLSRLTLRRMTFKGRRLGAIFVDHIGHIRTPQIKNNPVAAMTYVSGSMKGLARELSVPVIALSQLSRAVEQRDDKRPQLADLRESGAIEQDADSVIMLYREDYYVQNGQWKPAKDKDGNAPAPRPSYEAEARIVKNRHGKTGVETLWCDMGHSIMAERMP